MGAPRVTGVKVDGLNLNTIDTSGVLWEFTSIVGWQGGPGVTVTQTPRMVSPGAYSQPGQRGGRVITINGWIKAADRTRIVPALNQLNALLADGGFGVFEFTDRTEGRLWVDVQLNAEPDIVWNGGPQARYQLQLFAPEAYRYGTTSSDYTGFAAVPTGAGFQWDAFPSGVAQWGALGSQGVATVTNAGTAPATPVFTVTGPTPAGGFTIRDGDGGKALTFLSVVPSGSTLVLDAAAGTALLDGNPDADRSGDLIVEAWPTIGRGASKTFLFEPITGTSAAVLTVECTATYW